MRQAGLVLAFVFAATGPAMAACPAGTQTVLSCSAKGGTKALDVCLDLPNATISYVYGAPNRQPELTMRRLIAAIDHTPWPGIGRSIWESTVFHNQGYAYEVFISVDRMADNSQPIGGVVLHKGSQQVAQVNCDADTAEIGLWAVSYTKKAVGQCWDLGTQN